MRLKAYAIRDSKAGFYGKPFFSHTHGEAERSFRQLAKDPASQLSSFPDDFDLFHLGEYDDSTGLFQALGTPEHIIKANALN